LYIEEKNRTDGFRQLTSKDTDLLIPKLAKDPPSLKTIEDEILKKPTTHRLILGDGRRIESIDDESVHLVVTSPPYWTLKKYNRINGQLGCVDDYEAFLSELDTVWAECLRLLVPGGRLVIVVGDVLLSRRKHGRHTAIPLHADIQVHCARLGYDNLAPIFWYKIANVAHEAVRRGGGFLGKPYEPNAVVKHDIEYILMERKPGGYRRPSVKTRLLSVIPAAKHRKWFRQVWKDVPGKSTRQHPAPFPEKLAERLTRMFSFVGDTVLDPFCGTGTTMVAASRCGRNGIGVEIDPEYVDLAEERLQSRLTSLAAKHRLIVEGRDSAAQRMD
jgi:DNA modification methylase